MPVPTNHPAAGGPGGAGEPARVGLRPWTPDDFGLLHRANTPGMTEHLGGPESEERLRDRQERYLAAADPVTGVMYSVVLLPGGTPVGTIGYWERLWEGRPVYETGWNVFPEYQHRGIAARAAALTVDRVRAQRRHRHLHAYPAADNPASNAICRKAGFSLLGECDVEYPPGHMMRCHNWRLDLHAP
ncbi:GNAT family N-acetyltransferase [Streptomyces sp. Z26]|uniref:GNAT family N-acetyltransferase n=1 Tax=Streptomyces sp. Z26 TaxID=2500177 RepID=UPI000EF17379|nr:GNAT family N-acetyltransferase [Streptomyces sp. Z26]RLL68281.1 N-acetyltransferase [Streptomyces sp. Z26]